VSPFSVYTEDAARKLIRNIDNYLPNSTVTFIGRHIIFRVIALRTSRTTKCRFLMLKQVVLLVTK
jgi:hypothetical protein